MAAPSGWKLGLLLLLPLACGCGHNQPPSPPTTQPADGMFTNTFAAPGLVYTEIKPDEELDPKGQFNAQLEVIDITAAVASISRDEAFWKVINQQAMDPQWLKFLQSTQLRVGLMDLSAWGKLKGVIDHYAVTSQQTTIQGNARSTIVCKSAAEKSIFFFDRKGRLQGRSYDQSDYLWGITYAIKPGQPKIVTMEMCPVVRAERKQMQFSRSGTDYELKYVQPEALYELGLKLDVPVGKMLVLAPTPDASRFGSSIGASFLINDEQSRMSERILAIYPRVYRYNEQATEEQIRRALKQN